ncbi:MAG: hypothetical protein C4521_03700 [Actinobacteria bacterium]|nr:MAG: hypothetical protein C4521_03700 [Actinomycetota bacterium]
MSYRRITKQLLGAFSFLLLLPLIFLSTGCNPMASWAGWTDPEPARPKITAQTQRAEVAKPEWEPDPALARLIVAEQQESREYYRRLAEGQVTRFTVKGVRRFSGRYIVDVTASFSGLAEEDFQSEFTRRDGLLFLMATTQGSPLASVANIGPEEQRLGERLMREEREHQQYMRELVADRIAYVTIDSVNMGRDISELSCTLHYRNRKTKRGTLVMEFVHGFWYLMSCRGV